MGIVTMYDPSPEVFCAIHALLVVRSLPEGYDGKSVIGNEVQRKAVGDMVRVKSESDEVYVDVPNVLLKKAAAAAVLVKEFDSDQEHGMIAEVLKD